MDPTNNLVTLLRSKFSYEARDISSPSERQLRILGRMPEQRMVDWLAAMLHVHTRLESQPAWSVDISKLYFKRNGKMVYAWRLIFQSLNNRPILEYLQDIINAFAGAEHGPRGEVMEIPLMGASMRSRTATGGRGAYTVGGSSPFVPNAARR